MAQERVLNSLLSNARFDRLVEQEAIDGMAAYKPADFMSDVRRGIWSELEGWTSSIDVYRRNLQNSYIELLSNKLNVRPSVTDDYRALIKAELRDLSAAINAAMPRATDRQTRAHLADARDQIAKALDPKFAAPAPTPPTFNPFGFDDEFEFQRGFELDRGFRFPRLLAGLRDSDQATKRVEHVSQVGQTEMNVVRCVNAAFIGFEQLLCDR